eukprot:680378-Pelagomonas_calceolata.AAC.1
MGLELCASVAKYYSKQSADMCTMVIEVYSQVSKASGAFWQRLNFPVHLNFYARALGGGSAHESSYLRNSCIEKFIFPSPGPRPPSGNNIQLNLASSRSTKPVFQRGLSKAFKLKALDNPLKAF